MNGSFASFFHLVEEFLFLFIISLLFSVVKRHCEILELNPVHSFFSSTHPQILAKALFELVLVFEMKCCGRSVMYNKQVRSCLS